MTEQEQRIAIAEACGWKGQLYRVVSVAPDYKELACPDYTRSLDAMADAFDSLKGNQRGAFVDNLDLALGYTTERPAPMGIIVNAPADKRAEAFLRTIGKWIE